MFESGSFAKRSERVGGRMRRVRWRDEVAEKRQIIIIIIKKTQQLLFGDINFLFLIKELKIIYLEVQIVRY